MWIIGVVVVVIEVVLVMVVVLGRDCCDGRRCNCGCDSHSCGRSCWGCGYRFVLVMVVMMVDVVMGS